jgi:hypothetical protein
MSFAYCPKCDARLGNPRRCVRCGPMPRRDGQADEYGEADDDNVGGLPPSGRMFAFLPGKNVRPGKRSRRRELARYGYCQ